MVTDGQSLLDAARKKAGIQSSTSNEPMVYFGKTYNYDLDIPAMDRGKGTQVDKKLTLDQAYQSFYTWTPAEQQAWGTKLYKAGIINDPGNYDAVFAAWQSAVNFAGSQYTYGGKPVTPFDVLNQRLGITAKANGASKTTTSTQTSVQHIDPADAEAMVKSVYQNAVGRDPDESELNRFRSLLMKKLEKNPQTTKTTTTVDSRGNSSSSSDTSGGIDSAGQQQYLTDKEQADPEYGAYQAATKYFNVLQDVFGPSANVSGGG